MTAARQQRKPLTGWETMSWIVRGGFGFLFAVAAGALAANGAGNDPVVVDRHTGLALSGFDPVAFFTDARPTLGSDDIELRLGGAVWRFRNIGNRAAFEARPDVYLPRF